MSVMVWVWLGLAVVFGIIELATVQLATVWFALGAVVSCVLAVAGADSIVVQIVVFTVVSLIALVLTRPVVKRMTEKKKQPTNADRNIGKTAIVETQIDNANGSGVVKLSGITWSAKSENGSIIPSGARVVVKAIEGVKLIVSEDVANS